MADCCLRPASKQTASHRGPRVKRDDMETVGGRFCRPPAGNTAAIEYRWAEGSSKRVSEIASEFLRQNADVIVTYGSAVTVLKQVTAEIPIVFAVAFDPVRGGLVQSMARPGGNITGMSI